MPPSTSPGTIGKSAPKRPTLPQQRSQPDVPCIALSNPLDTQNTELFLPVIQFTHHNQAGEKDRSVRHIKLQQDAIRASGPSQAYHSTNPLATSPRSPSPSSTHSILALFRSHFMAVLGVVGFLPCSMMSRTRFARRRTSGSVPPARRRAPSSTRVSPRTPARRAQFTNLRRPPCLNATENDVDQSRDLVTREIDMPKTEQDSLSDVTGAEEVGLNFKILHGHFYDRSPVSNLARETPTPPGNARAPNSEWNAAQATLCAVPWGLALNVRSIPALSSRSRAAFVPIMPR